MKTIICVTARLNSTRLPQKALLDIKYKPAIQHLFDRLKRTNRIVVLCTGPYNANQKLIELAKRNGIPYIAGSEKDVLSRYLQAIDRFDADNIVRITGDDILTDIDIMEGQIEYHCANDSDYTEAPGVPKGMEVEVMASKALFKAYAMAQDRDCTEYLTWYMQRSDVFKCLQYRAHGLDMGSFNLTLDTGTDYVVLSSIMDRFSGYFSAYDFRDLVNRMPDLVGLSLPKQEANRPLHVNVAFKGDK